jgi:hypothetical protein
MVKPIGSVLLFSIWVVSAQDGARQKLKRCPELSGNKLSEKFCKLSLARTAMGNARRIHFVEPGGGGAEGFIAVETGFCRDKSSGSRVAYFIEGFSCCDVFKT